MQKIFWNCFNADNPNPNLENALKELSDRILIDKGVDKKNPTAVRSFAESEISEYFSGLNQEPNQTLGVDIFRPHEFNSILLNDESLDELRDWFLRQPFEWRDGSKTVQIALDKNFIPGGPKRIQGGREAVILDNLVIIKGRKVAVEIETSNNFDNGYWTLRQSLRSGMANYGVMIAPWTAEGQGRANEGKTLGRLDREFDGATCLRDGPIYRIAIIRRLYVYRLLLKD